MELLRDRERRARLRLPEVVYDYFAGGAGDERTPADNEKAWRHLWLRPAKPRKEREDPAPEGGERCP